MDIGLSSQIEPIYVFIMLAISVIGLGIIVLIILQDFWVMFRKYQKYKKEENKDKKDVRDRKR